MASFGKNKKNRKQANVNVSKGGPRPKGQCPACDGTGKFEYKPGRYEKCKNCDATGKVDEVNESYLDPNIGEMKTLLEMGKVAGKLLTEAAAIPKEELHESINEAKTSKLKQDAITAVGRLLNATDDPKSVKALNDIQNKLRGLNESITEGKKPKGGDSIMSKDKKMGKIVSIDGNTVMVKADGKTYRTGLKYLVWNPETNSWRDR